MARSEQPLPLRERKKLRTRAAIRRVAADLIERNGYANTTVEQIAEAAEVSASTFFRYFSSKQSVLMGDEIVQAVVSALANQPPEVPTVQAFRHSLESTWNALTSEEWDFELRCRQLVLAIPELQEFQHVEHRRSAATMSEAECRRLGRDPGDFEVHVFFGALLGALLTALNAASEEFAMPEQVFRALAFIEAGMPLQRSDNPTQ